MVNKELESSNANGWELEIVCKNQDYKNAVISALINFNFVDFEVTTLECNSIFNESEKVDGRWSIFITCYWFNNLKDVAEALSIIEKTLSLE